MHTDPGSSSRAAGTAAEGDKGKAVADEPVIDEDEPLCCICLETPVTYGLLAGCSHIFCVQCIREWRDPHGKSVDVVFSGVTKKCPLCRSPSQFVTPSSRFYPDGTSGKTETIEKYKASMSRVPCRHFQKSPPNDRFCPFGKDCFYQHRNADGSTHVFDRGVDYYMKLNRRRNSRRSGLVDFSDDQRELLDNLQAAIDAIRDNLPTRTIGENGGLEPGEQLQFMVPDEIGPPETADGVMNRLGSNHYEYPTLGWENFLELMGVMSNDLRPSTETFQQRDAHPPPLLVDPEPQAHTHEDVQTTASTPTLPTAPLDIGHIEQQLARHYLANTSPPAPGHPSRFSTRVLGRSRSLSDLVDRSIPIARGNRSPTLSIAGDLADSTSILSADEPAEESNTLTESVEAIPSDSDSSSTCPLTPTAYPPVSQQVVSGACGLPAAADEWTTPAAPSQDEDPPLLTDGRGRVVWSTMSATRSRRGRASTSAGVISVIQHKSESYRRDASLSIDRESSIGNHLSELGRSPRTRTRSLPAERAEGSQECLVTDGRGRVISVPS